MGVIRAIPPLDGGLQPPPHLAISTCKRLTFSAMHTKSHSPCALLNPRTLKRRNPSTLLDPAIGRFGQPLARRVAAPAGGRGQLLGHALRRPMPLGVDDRRLLALPTQCHVPINAARFQLLQVPLIAVPGNRPAPCAGAPRTSSAPHREGPASRLGRSHSPPSFVATTS